VTLKIAQIKKEGEFAKIIRLSLNEPEIVFGTHTLNRAKFTVEPAQGLSPEIAHVYSPLTQVYKDSIVDILVPTDNAKEE
jgi:hypothetical protein